jgi:Arc/MetJ family transcription regulator
VTTTLTKNLIEIPDELMAAAMEALGTTTKADTVRTALELVTRQRRQRDFMNWIAESGVLEDLNDPAIRAAARG